MGGDFCIFTMVTKILFPSCPLISPGVRMMSTPATYKRQNARIRTMLAARCVINHKAGGGKLGSETQRRSAKYFAALSQTS